MAEKMIKFLIFTYGKEVPNPLHDDDDSEPETVLVEGMGRLGEVVDITRNYDLNRGEELGAFFSDEDREAIESGTYAGEDGPAVQQARLVAAQTVASPVDVESGGAANIPSMSSEEIAAYIEANDLTVPETIALAPEDDVDSINKVLDAENLATENEPRAGVVRALEARLAKASES